MSENQSWVVYTTLDRSSIYSDWLTIQQQIFGSATEAEAFLNKPVSESARSPLYKEIGWLGPVPVQDLSLTVNANRFHGPWLREELSFSTEEPPELSLDEFVDQTFDDLAVDYVPDVLTAFAAKGSMPDGSDPCGPEHTERVRQDLAMRGLPNIECCLSKSWGFRDIECDARRRLGHVSPNRSKTRANQILDAAVDLEHVLRRLHPATSAEDVIHFWTSLEVHVYLAEFCRKILWRHYRKDWIVEESRREFCRALGSYAHQIRSIRAVIPERSDRKVIEEQFTDERPILQSRPQAKKPTRTLRAHRRSILKTMMTDKMLDGMDALAWHLGVSVTALQGMVRGDKTRYAADKLTAVLTKIGCSRAKWNRVSKSAASQ